MRKSRLISVPLATAALSATALAGPASAASHLPGPPTWPEHPQPITSYAMQLPGPPTWPANPKPITDYRSSLEPAHSRDFDLGSAGIGAGMTVLALTAGAAGVVSVRRRRVARAQSITTT